VHLGFDGLFLEQPNTGSGQYAVALLRQLAGRPDLRLTVLRPEPAPAVARAAAAELPVVGLPAPAWLGNPRLRKVWWEQIGLPRAAARAGVDLIHIPYFAAPLRPRRPVIATVHDVIPLVLPLYAGSAAMRLYLRLVSRAVRGAAAVLTDSDAARRDIMRVLRLPPARVTTVPLAAGEAMRPLPPAAVAPVLARHGVRPPYLVNAGGFDARKNLPFLVRAVARATAGRPDWQLVIIGRPHTGNARIYPDVRPVVAAEGLAERTIFTGFVSEADKAALYAGAGLCVFPTLYEGFGLTPLEAMACGAPVLAGNRSSLPEVVGDGGALADPTDLDAFAAAIAALLDAPDRRAALARAGLARAARFTWAATAEQTVAVYRRALDGSGGAGEQGSRGAGERGEHPHPSPLPQRGRGEQPQRGRGEQPQRGRGEQPQRGRGDGSGPGEAAASALARPAPSPASRERAGGEGGASTQHPAPTEDGAR
jgi:glycosyltransferase involved in cell wall biosynthesis